VKFAALEIVWSLMRPEVIVLAPRLRAPLEVMAPDVIVPPPTLRLAAVRAPENDPVVAPDKAPETLAEPLKLCPQIVRAVSRVVADTAFSLYFKGL